MRELTDKQAAFCREYVIDFNATQAAIRAGYSKNGAEVTASKLLTNPKVSAEVARLVKKSADKAEITIDRTLKELAIMSFYNPAGIFNENDTVKSWSEIPEELQRVIVGFKVREEWDDDKNNPNANPIMVKVYDIKLSDKGRAIEQCAKYLQLYVDRVEHNHSLDAKFEMVVAQMCPHCGKAINKIDADTSHS